MRMVSVGQFQENLVRNRHPVYQDCNILTTASRMKVLSTLDEAMEGGLETMKKQKELRDKAVQEILSSEKTYLYHLELVVKYFMNPIRERFNVPKIIFSSLFGNIETLQNMNTELLQELQQNPENVADAFLKFAPFLKLYSVYAYDYRQAMSVLQNLHKTNPGLNTFIHNQEKLPIVGMKLTSLLITPIQRVPRYRLLLKEVLAHTTSMNGDSSCLKAALAEVEKTAEHINKLVQDYENMLKMLELQRSLVGGVPNIISPGRQFLKEGVLMKVSPEGRKAHSRFFVLFSDMLLYCKQQTSPLKPNSLKCCCMLPLKKCVVDELLSKGMFKVTCQNEVLILYSKSREEGALWVIALNDAIKKYQESRLTLRKDSSARRPLRRPYIRKSNSSTIAHHTTRKRKRKQESDSTEAGSEDGTSVCFPHFEAKISSTKRMRKDKMRKSDTADSIKSLR